MTYGALSLPTPWLPEGSCCCYPASDPAPGSQQVWTPAPESNRGPQPHHTTARRTGKVFWHRCHQRPTRIHHLHASHTANLVRSSCDRPLVPVTQLLFLGQRSRVSFTEVFPLLPWQLLVFALPKFSGVGTVPSLRLSVSQYPNCLTCSLDYTI